jgi:hypothetical protein
MAPPAKAPPWSVCLGREPQWRQRAVSYDETTVSCHTGRYLGFSTISGNVPMCGTRVIGSLGVNGARFRRGNTRPTW